MGTYWERLQTGKKWQGAIKWQPKEHNHPWISSLMSIIHTCIDLMTSKEYPENISFCLHMYYDAHVPIMCALD